MLWAVPMILRRIAMVCVLLLLPLGGLDCEPMDEAPPPATPPHGGGSPLPPEPPSSPSETGGNDNDSYASGEVTIGGESEGYDDDDPAALTDFHATLDPHGTWVDDTTYGTVWVPKETEVGKDFQPYVTAGHWVYDDDWVWVSEYDWGWAPFHYGRWVWIEGRGWVWIPGRVYRGAWVAWGVDDGYTYVGWAPLAPSFVWFGGVAVGFPVYVGPRWVYCPRGEVFFPPGRRRVVAGPAAGSIAVRVRPYVPATPGVSAAGPSPQRLGFQAEQIPHASGAEGAGVARAQQFSRPPTAQALGARGPTRLPAATQVGPLRGSGASPMGQTPRGPVFGGPFRGTGAGRGGGSIVGASPGAPSPARLPAAGAPGSSGTFRPPVSSGQGAGPVTPAPAPAPFRPSTPAPAARTSPSPMRAPSFRGGGVGGGHHR
jgi:hypothetical protein